MVFITLFTMCFLHVFSSTYQKTIVGVSLGVIIMVFTILAIVFAARGSTARFIFFRVVFWVVGYLISVLLFEPLLIIVQFYLCRCEDCCGKVEKEEEKLIREEEGLIDEDVTYSKEDKNL